LEEIRAEKSSKFKELKGNRKNPEYEEYFLRYRPADKLEDKKAGKTKTAKTVKRKPKTKKRGRGGLFY
jgi:hypothetical protein